MKVFDSSAVLAMIFGEPGAAQAAAWMAEGDGVISSVNLAEILAKVRDHGMDEDAVETVRAELPLAVEPFSAEHAAGAGRLRAATRALGLSLGDRCCLALAQASAAPVVTADRPWKSLKGFDIQLIRP